MQHVTNAHGGGRSTDGHNAPERPFPEILEASIADAQLSRNLTNFQQSYRESREAIMADVDFPALRASMKAAKAEAIDQLDRYLDQFIAQAKASGAQVHLAADADEATYIIRQLASDHGVTTVAKSKSMVSEEVELNHALEADGIEVVETDLGEWIVQLRRERPSHMVMPAIHLARQQVGDVMEAHLGRPISHEDVDEQVHIARDAIRDVFFRAGMGITGANALVAESGAVMMITNEGNARLTSSVPPLHVVIAGIEKLVPTYDDAITQVRLLARSATAQRMTVNTTFIQGPTPGHEQHIVLVDNGRRAMRDRPEFREALHCIRCAACANVCPPYREVGGHAFGYIYTGAIGLVVTPFLHGVDKIARPQSLCLSCNACETVCPVEIPLPRQILDVRAMVVEQHGMKPAKRAAMAAWSRPRIANLLLKIGRVAQKPLVSRRGLIRNRRIPILNRQTSWRSLPALRGKARRRETAAPSTIRGTVALFPACMTANLYPEQAVATRKVLEHLGYRVIELGNLHCCGLIPGNSGDRPDAKRLARQTLDQLLAVDADYVVSPSASCVAMMAQDYLHLFRDDPDDLLRAKRLAPKVMDFTSFLVNVARPEPGSFAPADGSSRTVTYHDSCQGQNALGLRPEPRYLIEQVMGDRIEEMAETTLCCGFGGSFSIEHPEISRRLMARKLANADATGVTTIVTDNQGCIMHLRGGADASGRPLRVTHIAELLADRI